MNLKPTILVTGSSRGIGKATATLAHQRGYRVIVHGRTLSQELKSTHKKLVGSELTVFDLEDKKQTQEKIKEIIEKIGGIDVLVNNAGIALNLPKDIADVDDEKALKEWRVNVLGPIHCIQAVLPVMLKKGKGSVINIASIKGIPNYSTLSSFTYAHTKAAVFSLTKSLAKTYSPKGIRFNSVAPGYVYTDILKDRPPETWERVNNGTLLGRLGKTEEVAQLVMFLASDESAYITGAEFVIDGGYTIKGK